MVIASLYIFFFVRVLSNLIGVSLILGFTGNSFAISLYTRCFTASNRLFDNLLCVFVKAKHFLLTFVSEIKIEPSLTYLYNIKMRPL